MSWILVENWLGTPWNLFTLVDELSVNLTIGHKLPLNFKKTKCFIARRKALLWRTTILYWIMCLSGGVIWFSSQHLIYLRIGGRYQLNKYVGGGPRVVVSTAALHARVRGSVPGLGGLKETKNVSSPSTCESQYCGEPPWPRGSVLGLRRPRFEFRILCLEDSGISIISPSSGGSPGPV